MKKKMKEFYQEHKEDITNFAWMVIGATVGVCTIGVVYRREVFLANENLKKVLVGAQREFGGGNMTIVTANHIKGLSANQLGELGDVIVKCGGQDNIFKYFIAIGPDKK